MSDEPDFMDTRDIADRIASALMAITRGDDTGAALVLDGTNAKLVEQFFASLLTLTAHFGCLAMGPEAFIAELANWREAIASLPPDWWEKAKNAQQN